jgi:hypothetical protein
MEQFYIGSGQAVVDSFAPGSADLPTAATQQPALSIAKPLEVPRPTKRARHGWTVQGLDPTPSAVLGGERLSPRWRRNGDAGKQLAGRVRSVPPRRPFGEVRAVTQAPPRDETSGQQTSAFCQGCAPSAPSAAWGGRASGHCGGRPASSGLGGMIAVGAIRSKFVTGGPSPNGEAAVSTRFGQ